MSKLTLLKSVPATRAPQYLSCGWKTSLPQPDPYRISIKFSQKTSAGRDQVVDLSYSRRLYLVQRALIRQPLDQHKGDTLTAAVSLDYMGSAEFEWGALPKSLRCIQAQFDLYQLRTFERIKCELDGQERSLKVFANFDSDEEAQAYEDKLVKAVQGEHIGLKEPLRLVREGGQVVSSRCDFWWDIQANVMFSFDTNFMASKLHLHLRESFHAMND